MRRSLALSFAAVSAYVNAQVNNPDPINNFCRRFSHQTAVIDNKLFIDGGYVNYGPQITSQTINFTNTDLLYADLNTVSKDSFPTEFANLSKPANVPSVVGGKLWADEVNKIVYLFGGEYNSTVLVPQQYTLWYYDALYNTWNATPTDPTAASISPLAFGASAIDNNLGFAYWYGGWRTNLSDASWTGNATMQSDLISYDFVNNKWRAAPFFDATPRAEGGLYYIPASDAGMLVYFGGQQYVDGSYTGVPMDTVYLYDIGTGQTYTQKTSGTPPAMRRLFCGGVSWPEDRSSYQIYFFGGLPPPDEEGIGFADVWILSIPSFTWILWLDQPGRPHHSLTCDVVNKGQMIIMGGAFPNSSDVVCDVNNVWGQHGLSLGADNIDHAPWYQYLTNLTTYTVPSNVTAKIGGSVTGGATLETPVGGFDSSDLQTYLGRQAPTGTREPIRPIPATSTSTSTATPNSKSNVGAIAGGVVGGAAVLILLLAFCFLCLRRRKRDRIVSPQPSSNTGLLMQQHPLSPQPQSPYQQQPLTLSEAPGHETYFGSAFHHKRAVSGAMASHPESPDFNSQQHHNPRSQHESPSASPPPNAAQWQQHSPPLNTQPSSSPPLNYRSGFREELPAQQYFPPPPQALQYFPPPPPPQTTSTSYDAPMHEMPNVRSPTNVAELESARWRSASAGADGVPAQRRIEEEA